MHSSELFNKCIFPLPKCLLIHQDCILFLDSLSPPIQNLRNIPIIYRLWWVNALKLLGSVVLSSPQLSLLRGSTMEINRQHHHSWRMMTSSRPLLLERNKLDWTLLLHYDRSYLCIAPIMTRTLTCNEHAQSTLYILFGQWVAAGSCGQCCACTACVRFQGVSWSRERAKIPVENQASVKGMRARTALENAIWIVDTK